MTQTSKQSSRGECHASQLLLLESEGESQTSVGSGRRLLILSESLNRPLRYSRMLLASSVWRMAKHLTGYSLTWKMKATPQNRLLFQLVPSERGTDETEFGLLPTIKAQESGVRIEDMVDKDGEPVTGFNERWYNKDGKHKTIPLGQAIKLLPTPRTQEPGRTTEGYGRGLAELVEGKERIKMLPTPDCSDRRSMNSKQQGLSNVVRMFPTATTRDYKGGRTAEALEASGRNETNSLNDTVNALEGKTGQLNAAWVEWLQGYPVGWTDIGTENPRVSQE